MDVKLILQMLPQVISLISEASKLLPTQGAVPKYLDILAVVVGQGAKAYDELVALKDLVLTMVQQQREPTAEEWRTMQARSDIANSTIQSYNFDTEPDDMPLPAVLISEPKQIR
jgi:hypothetical protein